MTIEDTLKQIEIIAASFSPSSTEFCALALAAQALLFTEQENIRSRFESFLKSSANDLTSSQKAHLKRMGIEI